MAADEFLMPAPDEDSAEFWEGCSRGELRMQACTACGRRRFPPRPMCPWCRSFEHEWQTMSGLGTVWSVVVPHPPLLPAYAAFAPYNVVVVALDDDPSLRLVGNVVSETDEGIDSVDPHSIGIDDRVQVAFDSPVDGIAMPRWLRSEA